VRPRPLDYLALAISVFAVVAVSIYAYGTDRSASQVSIQTDDGTFLYPLDEDRRVTVTGPIGETVLEIHDEEVHVESSPCRDKICIAAGWLSSAGQWTACLPNRVFVRVGGSPDEDEVDAQTY